MKNLLYFAVLSFFLFVSCSENENEPEKPKSTNIELIENFEVGLQPSEIYYDEVSGNFNIFCLGYDNNFNFAQDEGDEVPSWWIINKSDIKNPQKVMDFDWGYLGFPFRPHFDTDSRKLYINQNEKLLVYDIDNHTKIDEIEIGFSANAISVSEDILYASVSPPDYVNSGDLLSWDLKNNSVINSAASGVRVQQNLIFENNSGKKILVVISEGTGANDAQIQFININDGVLSLESKIENFGSMANHITINGNTLAVTMNSTHVIYLFDLETFTIRNTIPTQTEGWNGPRETLFINDNEFITSTYNSDIRHYTTSGELLNIYPINSYGEGIAKSSNDYLLVSNISYPDYTPNNLVSVFKIEQ